MVGLEDDDDPFPNLWNFMAAMFLSWMLETSLFGCPTGGWKVWHMVSSRIKPCWKRCINMRDPLKPLGSIVVVHCGVADYSYKESNFSKVRNVVANFSTPCFWRVYRFQHKWWKPPRKSSARLWTWISSWWFQIFFTFTPIPVPYGSKWGHFEESGSQVVILSKHLSGSSSGA